MEGVASPRFFQIDLVTRITATWHVWCLVWRLFTGVPIPVGAIGRSDTV